MCSTVLPMEKKKQKYTGITLLSCTYWWFVSMGLMKLGGLSICWRNWQNNWLGSILEPREQTGEKLASENVKILYKIQGKWKHPKKHVGPQSKLTKWQNLTKKLTMHGFMFYHLHRIQSTVIVIDRAWQGHNCSDMCPTRPSTTTSIVRQLTTTRQPNHINLIWDHSQI